MALLVRIRESRQGPERRLVFKASPVTLGQNPLNDLTLENEFVSDYHGMIDFSRNEVVYVDLRSTNGTDVDGEPIPQGIPVRVANADTRVSIGPFHLKIEWTDQLEGAAVIASAKRTVGLTGLPIGLRDHRDGTQRQPESVPEPVGDATHETLTPEPAHDVTAPVPPPRFVINDTGDVGAQGHYAAYRRSWAELLARLRQEISSAEPARREIVAFNLVAEFPQVSLEPEFARMLKELGIEQASLICLDIQDWVERLTGTDATGAAAPTNYALVVERIGNIVGVFAESLLHLRRGYQEARKELGLPLPHEQGPLDRASDATEVIRYLMALEADQTDTLDALRRSFGEFPRHQVALLSGVREGSRDLLEWLGPDALSAGEVVSPGSGAIVQRTQQLLSAIVRVWPVAPIIQWGRYKRRFESELEDDHFTKRLFGKKFARTYFQLMGSR